ncbi:dipeptidase PepE [Flavobacterium sp. UMI-01]|uniref:dipeptidase PepE n=1 Tax=Flavobacterium sp. UMI-01 TaxID=1441053 RepID=UPI001C7DE10E|nr:dipeptidase PepE [Flavobacterium sp. UMI-01]GIZ08982.1 dipeptidase E [Flavobacterium sp. UMI-01]
MKNVIIASTSTLHREKPLDYLSSAIKALFKGCDEILFIPYARPSGITHEEYTEKMVAIFGEWGIGVKGIHEFENPIKALQEASGIFTGGGNTFLLVSQLYANKIMATLSEVVKKGTPYLGTSAGSNICGLTMQTTNDMPIVYPPSFQTLGVVPFNINPHFQDADLSSTHMGETRETRIHEFHAFNAIPVLGLREGSWLEVNNNAIVLRGNLFARLFQKGKQAEEVASGTDLTFLK